MSRSLIEDARFVAFTIRHAYLYRRTPLARAETRILLEWLMARFPRFELAGPGRRVDSFLRNGWVEMPVVFYDS